MYAFFGEGLKWDGRTDKRCPFRRVGGKGDRLTDGIKYKNHDKHYTYYQIVLSKEG